MKKASTKVNYVDNKKFYNEIVAYHERLAKARKEGKEDPRIPDYIGECIMKIAEKLSTKPCFMNYSFRDEMISDGIENCILYFKNYDPKRGANPFAYFTQVISFAFIRRINKEERARYTMYKSFQETIGSHNDMDMFTDDNDKKIVTTRMYENIDVFMENFERKEEEKKEKRRIAKELKADLEEVPEDFILDA